MKELKAYVHAHRIAEVIAALKASSAWGAGPRGDTHNLSVYLVKGSLVPIDSRERHFSLDLGEEVVNEYKLELMCDEAHVDELVAIIRSVGRTGQANAGWVLVTDVQAAFPIV